jgi:hypothetical protein
VGNVVGDLAQALVQAFDAAEHSVQRVRQAVELVAGAADRQALGEIARHDLLACGRHAVDAL